MRALTVLTSFLLLFPAALAVFNPADCTNMSWWLRMEEPDGGAGTFIYDACPELNNFMRLGPTEREAAAWDYGQRIGPSAEGENDWLILNNASALTTGSRTWRTIININYRIGTGIYSDNETSTAWNNFMLYEGDDLVYCFCNSLAGSRYVFAPLAVGIDQDVLCSYDTEDNNNLSLYVNAILYATLQGDACDIPPTDGQVIIDSYPVVGSLPRLNARYDETFYRRQASTPQEVYCLYTFNNLGCVEPEPIPNITIGGCCNAGGVYNIPVGEPTLQTCVYIGNETTSYIVNKTYITRTCCGSLENLSCCPCEHSILESCLYGCENGLGCKDAAFLPGANNREKTEALAWGIFLLMMIAAYLMTTVNSWTQKALMFLITLLAAIFVTAIFPFPLTLIGVTAILLSVVYMISLVEGARRNE